MKRIIYLLCLCILVVGCSKKYDDTNGKECYDLQTISDQNIIHLDVGASGLSYSEESLNDIFFSSKYSSKDFNGVEQIYLNNYLINSSVHVYIGTMTIKSGNFKLAVINNDKIIYEFDRETFNQEFVFDDIKGSFSIHVAGESAAFEFDIDVY